MAQASPLHVQLVAHSQFHPPTDIGWETDAATDPEALVEFAGRACYETFNKPNPRTRSNDAYIRHIMEVGHLALLEHPTATIYVRGISRGATHELTRHRHFSFSQLSQRFVHPEESEVAVPKLIADDAELSQVFLRAIDNTRLAYDELLAALELKLRDEPNAVLRRKQSHQAAQAILPRATESRIVVTGNFRTWRHFIGMRATEHADVEIRELAVACLKLGTAYTPPCSIHTAFTTLKAGVKLTLKPP